MVNISVSGGSLVFPKKTPQAQQNNPNKVEDHVSTRGFFVTMVEKGLENLEQERTLTKTPVSEDPDRQFYQSTVPMDQRTFEPEPVGVPDPTITTMEPTDKKVDIPQAPEVTKQELKKAPELTSFEGMGPDPSTGQEVEDYLNLKDTKIFSYNRETGKNDIEVTNPTPVQKAQQQLTRLGYITTIGPLRVDNDLGLGTQRQLKKLQKTAGLPMTGQLDPETIKALEDPKNRMKDQPLSIDKTNEVLETIPDNLFEKIKEPIAQIESRSRYNIIGGFNDAYDGKYQLGKSAKDTIKTLSVFTEEEKTKLEHPSGRADFRADPALQEKAFKELVKANHFTLTRYSEKYRNFSMEQKLAILGYTHNQGNENTLHYLWTGVVGEDANGTKGTKYSDAIEKAFAPAAANKREENL